MNGLVEVAALGPENVRFFLPPPTILTPDGIAVLKGAPDRDVAEAFVAFVMSAEGQALWMKPPGTPGGPEKYPISRMGVWPPYYAGSTLFPYDPFVPEAGAEIVRLYDAETGSRRWAVVNDLLGQNRDRRPRADDAGLEGDLGAAGGGAGAVPGRVFRGARLRGRGPGGRRLLAKRPPARGADHERLDGGGGATVRPARQGGLGRAERKAMKVELHDVTKSFGKGSDRHRAVDGVSLALEPGEFFFLLGPSGCGEDDPAAGCWPGSSSPTRGRSGSGSGR